MPHLRFAALADLEALEEIERRAFPDPWSRSMLEGELESPYAFQLVVAPQEGARLVGYAAFLTAAEEAELLRLAVLPEERGRGYARALVERGLERLSWEGIERCFLEVREGNAAARGLYEDLGFRRAGRRKGYYKDGSDALIYVRRPDL